MVRIAYRSSITSSVVNRNPSEGNGRHRRSKSLPTVVRSQNVFSEPSDPTATTSNVRLAIVKHEISRLLRELHNPNYVTTLHSKRQDEEALPSDADLSTGAGLQDWLLPKLLQIKAQFHHLQQRVKYLEEELHARDALPCLGCGLVSATVTSSVPRPRSTSEAEQATAATEVEKLQHKRELEKRWSPEQQKLQASAVVLQRCIRGMVARAECQRVRLSKQTWRVDRLLNSLVTPPESPMVGNTPRNDAIAVSAQNAFRAVGIGIACAQWRLRSHIARHALAMARRAAILLQAVIRRKTAQTNYLLYKSARMAKLDAPSGGSDPFSSEPISNTSSPSYVQNHDPFEPSTSNRKSLTAESDVRASRVGNVCATSSAAADHHPSNHRHHHTSSSSASDQPPLPQRHPTLSSSRHEKHHEKHREPQPPHTPPRKEPLSQPTTPQHQAPLTPQQQHDSDEEENEEQDAKFYSLTPREDSPAIKPTRESSLVSSWNTSAAEHAETHEGRTALSRSKDSPASGTRPRVSPSRNLKESPGCVLTADLLHELCCLHLDDPLVATTPAFEAFVAHTAQLDSVTGMTTNNEMLAFFINVHNLLAVHSFVVANTKKASGQTRLGSIKKPSILSDAQSQISYRIGGNVFALEDIKYFLRKGVRSMDEDLVRLSRFACSSCTPTCPAIRVHLPHTLEASLRESAQEVVEHFVTLVPPRGQILLPEIFKVHSKDFGRKDSQLIAHVLALASPEKKEILASMLAKKAGVKVKYISAGEPTVPDLMRVTSYLRGNV